MKILLTGASGFIGRHALNALLQIQNVELSILVRDPQKLIYLSNDSRISIYKFDLSQELDVTRFKNHDLLLHLAWDNIYNYNDPEHIKNQLPLHCRFLDSVIKCGIKNLNVVGTCFEYGLLEGCLQEDAITNPVTAYGIAKDTLRKFVFLHQHNSDLKIKWMRPFYMHGPGQSERSLLASLDKSVNEGKHEFNMSGGEQLRDYLPVEKVAHSIIKVSLQQEIIGIINCCSGSPISVRSLVEKHLQEKHCGYSIKLNLGFYPYSIWEPIAFWGSVDKLKKIYSS